MSEKSDRISKELGYEPTKTKIPQAEKPEEAQGRDLFQTPNYAVNLLIPFIPKNIKWIWEPACGDGKIVHALYASKDRPLVCYQSDIRISETLVHNVKNFLTDEPPMLFDTNDWAIITNPPFSLKKKFYLRCLELEVPFALLIPADYSGWIIEACQNGAEKIIPTRRIDYITPSGKTGKSGHTADFHSMWLTKGFNLGKTETFVELSLKDKENI